MSSPTRIGFIGLDTSHVVEFAKIFNESGDPHHIPGFRVTCAYPGGSKDFELSWSRVGKFTDELKTQRGVTMLDSPEAVAEASDLVFIESVDGRVHLDQFRRTAPFKRPTFIDKPLTHSVADAKQIFSIADQHGVAVMPGEALGVPGFIRIGYICDDEATLQRGVQAVIEAGNAVWRAR